MRINIAVQNKEKINPFGRKVVRAHRARLTAVQSVNGMTATAVFPLPMTKGTKDGILMLGPDKRLHIKESFREGRTNVQAHLDVWPTGPYTKTGYVNPVEHFARVDGPRAAEGRPVFSFASEEALADELLHRVIVDPEEIEFEHPEKRVLDELGLEFMAGRFGDLPAKVGGTYFRAHKSGKVVARSHDRVTIKLKGDQKVIYWAPDGWTTNSFRTRSYLKKGTPLFKLLAPLEDTPVAQAIVDTVERRMFVSEWGKRFVRLSHAKKLPRYCVACAQRRGVFPLADRICPHCGGTSVEDTEERTACACGHTGPADHFRGHLTCPCGGATVVGVKNAYVVANSRYYDLESTEGKYISSPVGVAHIRAFFRRVKAGEVTIDPAEVRSRLVRKPRMRRVS